MSEIVYAQMHSHSKQSVNRLSGEGVFHKFFWPAERFVMKSIMLSPDDLSAEAWKHGISYIAVTDHNTIPSVRPELKRNTVIITGEEWGQKNGHANFYFMKKAIDPECGYFNNSQPESPKEFSVAAESARAQGAFISVNHPFKSDRWLWGDSSYGLADAVEIWNGRWNSENEQALSKWQQLLESGSRLLAMAGNDFHVRHLFSIDSQILAFSNIKGEEDLHRNLRAGNYSLAGNTLSPVLFLNRENGSMNYLIHKHTNGLRLKVITDTSTDEIDDPGANGILKSDKGSKFIRAELWLDGMPQSFTNPSFNSCSE